MSTILVVEDSPTGRVLVVTVLAAAGHTVREAEDGASARVAWRAEPLDLVLMDLRLPDASGDELTREMRAEGIDRPVVLAFSADALEALSPSQVEAGFDGFINKPIHPMKLGAQVAKYIAAGRRSA